MKTQSAENVAQSHRKSVQGISQGEMNSKHFC